MRLFIHISYKTETTFNTNGIKSSFRFIANMNE